MGNVLITLKKTTTHFGQNRMIYVCPPHHTNVFLHQAVGLTYFSCYEIQNSTFGYGQKS